MQVQREKRMKEELERYRRENPKITEQFADLKRKLGNVSYQEWEAIPAIGDYSIKKRRFQVGNQYCHWVRVRGKLTGSLL